MGVCDKETALNPRCLYSFDRVVDTILSSITRMLPTGAAGVARKRTCAGKFVATRGGFFQTETRETKVVAPRKESFTPRELDIDCETGVPTAACMRKCAHVLPYHAAASATPAPAVARMAPFTSYGDGDEEEATANANALRGDDALLGWMLVNWDPATTTVALAAHDIFGNTPLAVAISAKNERSVRLLLEAKASADARNCGGNNAVHFAAHAGSHRLVSLLVHHVADTSTLRAVNDAGFTPLDIARSCKVTSRRDALVGALTTPFPDVQTRRPQGPARCAPVGSAHPNSVVRDEFEMCCDNFHRCTQHGTRGVLQDALPASRGSLRDDEFRCTISTAFASFDDGEHE